MTPYLKFHYAHLRLLCFFWPSVELRRSTTIIHLHNYVLPTTRRVPSETLHSAKLSVGTRDDQIAHCATDSVLKLLAMIFPSSFLQHTAADLVLSVTCRRQYGVMQYAVLV